MALNDLTASILTRSNGGNAVARAAYNARECLKDDATGRNHDYRNKGGLEARGIFVAHDAPEWAKKLAQDRERLWNEVERREDKSTKPDQAQLARDFKIALPHELNEQQRLYLVKDFVRELGRKGLIVDWAIHQPDAHSDQRNYHAHLLTTMRRLEEEGFGHKMRQLNKVEQLEKWKDRWAELGARALERAGHEQEAERFKVGHKTLKFQREEAMKRGDMEHAEACDREPTIHLGPNVSAMERGDGGRKPILTDKGNVNRAINEQNRQRRAEREAAREPRGIPGEIWKAWHQSKDPEQFAEKLMEKRLDLAAVTKEEAERSRKDAAGKPVYREGEIVVVTEPRPVYRKEGEIVEPKRVYQLDRTTTGDDRAKIDQFLATLDRKPLLGMDATITKQNQRYTERMDKLIAARLDRSKVVEKVQRVSRVAGSTLAVGIGMPAEKIGDLLESLVAPKLTPEQVRQGERAERLRRAEGDAAERQRQEEAERAKDLGRDR